MQDWQKGKGCPCARCWMRNTCAADDKRCQEWISWFYREFRKKWKDLRVIFGMSEQTATWQYRAPYEPDPDHPGWMDTQDEEPEEEEKPAEETPGWLAELDRFRESGDRRAFGDALRALLKEHKITQYTLAAEADVGESTVGRAINAWKMPDDRCWAMIKGALIRLMKGAWGK